jgi:hypothetical protein
MKPLHLLLTVLVLTLGLAACNHENSPLCPGYNPPPTMENIWPHADGNVWTFNGTMAEYPNPDFEEGETPPESIPAMEELHADLQRPVEAPADTLLEFIYRMALDGNVTTESGVTAQQMTNTFYTTSTDKSGDRVRTVTEKPGRMLDLIAEARPDLAADIAPHLDKADDAFERILQQLFLSGYAFAYEDSGYYRYGDVDQNHSAIYLESSLDVGSEFSIQLLASIASDIWMHGRIWSQGKLTVGGTTYHNVVECLYVVDMGEAALVDESGTVLGTYHPYIYGTVHYAPDVGPIMSLERSRLGASVMTGEGSIVRDYRFELIGADIQE